MPHVLTLRPRPTPTFDAMSPLLVAQLGPLLDQARADGPAGHELIELFDVLDERGTHVYDMHLFCGDDGRVHRTGTLDRVASFSQGGATATDDASLREALGRALATWNAARRAQKVAAAPEPRPKARPTSKKPRR
jgi:hypothetical protein